MSSPLAVGPDETSVARGRPPISTPLIVQRDAESDEHGLRSIAVVVCRRSDDLAACSVAIRVDTVRRRRAQPGIPSVIALLASDLVALTAALQTVCESLAQGE